MPLSATIFLTLAVSHLAVLGLHILLYHRKTLLAVLSSMLVASLICYLIAEALTYWSNDQISTTVIIVRMILHRFGDMSVFLIWLIAFKLFKDDGRLRNMHPLVWVIAASIPAVRLIGSYYVNFQFGEGGFLNAFSWIYSQTLIFGFACAALYLAVQGYRSDLILERRKERVVFVLSVTVLLVIMVVNRGAWVTDLVMGSFPLRQPVPTVFYFIYAYVVVTALFLWKFKTFDLSTDKSASNSVNKSEQQKSVKLDKELMDRITHAMEREKLYHQSQLTVSDLADHVGSKEYLVRRTINNHLGYRNFSEFLNHYRIGETSALLVESNDPITNIGFDVGYISLASFYRAFKAIHGVTPKEYRGLHKPSV